MNTMQGVGRLEDISLDLIDVLNTRDRDLKIFKGISENVHLVGLKKPIKVKQVVGESGTIRYKAICGEGRVNIFRAAGESTIPCLVVDVTTEEAFIMSLVENIARRHLSQLDLLHAVEELHALGYEQHAIAAKIGMSSDRVHGILTLLAKGEDKLLIAVENGKIPLTAALTIVGTGIDDKALQLALQDAYESGQLRGQQLQTAKQIILKRQAQDSTGVKDKAQPQHKLTADHLVDVFRKEVGRQQMMIKRAGLAEQRLLFAVTAMRTLLDDAAFMSVLIRENLNMLPSYLAERLDSEVVV